MKFLAIIVIFIVLSLSIVNQEIFAETYTKSNKMTAQVDLGPLNVQADYDLVFKINTPPVIEAGDTVEVIVTPFSSTVTAKPKLLGESLGNYPTDLVLGQTATFGIPGGLGVGLFVKSNAYLNPGYIGPASISPRELVSLNNMAPQTFQVTVREDIGNYDSLILDFITILETKFGANLDLVLYKQELGSDTILLEPHQTMKITIPLKKTTSTNLSLDVRNGSCQTCIQVKPTLVDEYGQQIHSKNIYVFINGRDFAGGLTANQWTGDYKPGIGDHHIEVRFMGDSSSSNKAITYEKSIDSEDYTIKKIETPFTKQPSKTSSNGKSLTCGPGTHVDSNQCVADNFLDGFTWFFDDLIKQIGKMFS